MSKFTFQKELIEEIYEQFVQEFEKSSRLEFDEYYVENEKKVLDHRYSNQFKEDIIGFIKEFDVKLGKKKEDEEEEEEEEEEEGKGNKNTVFIKVIVIFSAMIFSILLVKLTIDKILSPGKLIVSIITLMGISNALLKYIEILNGNSVSTGSEKAKYTIMINCILSFEKEINPKKVKNFFKVYKETNSKSKNSHIQSRIKVEEFLFQQDHFMLKKENIGMGNNKYKDRFTKFYEFMFNDKIESTKKNLKNVTESLVHQFYVNKSEHHKTRKNLYEFFKNKNLTDELKRFYENASLTDEIVKDKIIQYSDVKGKITSIIGLMLEKTTELTPIDVDNKIKDIIRLNNALRILEIADLPEHDVLSNDLLFLKTDILKGLLSNEKRFMLNDEKEMVDLFIQTLLSCVSENPIHKNAYIMSLCTTNKSTNVLHHPKNILKTLHTIFSDFTSGDDNKKVMIKNIYNDIEEFIHVAKTDIIVKNDMLFDVKYKKILDVYESVFEEVFKHSEVKRLDAVLTFTKLMDDDNRIKDIRYFKNNTKKIIDILFDKYENNLKNKKILQSDTNIIKKQEYITFDQFSEKLSRFEEEDYEKFHNHLNSVYIDIDNVIVGHKSGVTNDSTSEKKIDLFRESITFYTGASFVFVMDNILTKIKTSGETEKEEGQLLVGGGLYMIEDDYDYKNNNIDIKGGAAFLAKASKAASAASKNAASVASKASASASKAAASASKAAAAASKNAAALKGKASAVATNAQGKAAGLKGKLTDAAINAQGKLTDAAKNAQGKLTDAAKNAQGKLTDAATFAQEKAAALKGKLTDAATNANETSISGSNTSLPGNDSVSNNIKQQNNKVLTKEQQIEKNEKDTQRIVNIFTSISYIISAWILSVIVLWAYWLKLDTERKYNEMVTLNNTVKLRELINDMKIIGKKIHANKHDRESHLKKLYDVIKELLTVNSKCNFTISHKGMKMTSVVFPYNELIIAFSLIVIITIVIYSNNMINNPFENMELINQIKLVNDFKNKLTKGGESNLEQTVQSNLEQTGGNTNAMNAMNTMNSMNAMNAMNTQAKSQNVLEETFKDNMKDLETLRKLRELDRYIGEPKLKGPIIQTSFGLTTLMMSLFLSYTIINNATRFKSDLYNGKMFGESMCW